MPEQVSCYKWGVCHSSNTCSDNLFNFARSSCRRMKLPWYYTTNVTVNSIVTQYMHYNCTFCEYMHIYFCQSLGADPGTELIPSHRTPASSPWLQVFVVSYGQLFSLPSDPVHWTSSAWIGPEPWPKWAPLNATAPTTEIPITTCSTTYLL